MNLHIFNPGHDIALAFNRAHLTMPHAAQELRMNLGWLPALWAEDGDFVYVDDLAYAQKASSHFKNRIAQVRFVESEALSRLFVNKILPWGWDVTLVAELNKYNVRSFLMPTRKELNQIRELSNRRFTTRLLPLIRQDMESQTCGEAYYLESIEQCADALSRFKNVVFKAPWSSSGRGIRFVNQITSHPSPSPSTAGWLANTIRLQGGVMAEPYYQKVKDFGMEFVAEANGKVRYCGLSLFETSNQAYTGNILASEDEKRRMLSHYIPACLLEALIERLCTVLSAELNKCYKGPLGVDMMVVARNDGKGFLVHPCVEVNLRRTMGHVALSLTPLPHEWTQKMQILYDTNYRLKISRL